MTSNILNHYSIASINNHTINYKIIIITKYIEIHRFILISIVCLAVPKKKVDFQDNRGGQIDERSSLVDNSDAPMYDDQPASGVTEQ